MKLTDEKRAWLQSEAAIALRKHYAASATLSINALMAAGMVSTDPTVRMHATSYATWKAAHKELELDPNEPD
jgi:hypothetical protein